MKLALWIVQGLLAFAFIAAGAMKLFAYEKYKSMSEKQNGPGGLTRGLISFIGVAELTGAIGIVLPMAAGVAPWLSIWAAVGLATIMLLAMGFHVRRRLRRLFSLRSHFLWCSGVFLNGSRQGGKRCRRRFRPDRAADVLFDFFGNVNRYLESN